MISEIALALVVNCMVIPLANRNVPVPKIVKNLLLGKISKYVLCNKKHSESKEMRFEADNDAFADSIFDDDVIVEEKLQKAREINGFIPKILKRSRYDSQFEEITLKYLKTIKNILKEDSHSKQIEDDWTEVVNILDRICFIAFTVAVITSGVVLMFEAPDVNL